MADQDRVGGVPPGDVPMTEPATNLLDLDANADGGPMEGLGNQDDWNPAWLPHPCL